MAAGSTYTPIATTTLSSDSNTVGFNTISGSYTDLIVVCNIKSASNGMELYMRLNSDTGTNYSRTILTGNGTSASSARNSNSTSMRLAYETTGTDSGNWSTLFIHLMNYSNSTTYKTVLCRAGDAAKELSENVGLWRSTSAITDISISGVNSFNAPYLGTGSTFTLYGITAA